MIKTYDSNDSKILYNAVKSKGFKTKKFKKSLKKAEAKKCHLVKTIMQNRPTFKIFATRRSFHSGPPALTQT